MNLQPKTAPYFRPSFTLVELLTVIAIIGIMVGMVLFSLAGAQQDAPTARTRSTINKLNDVILQEWEKFRYRSVRIDIPAEWRRPNVNPASGLVGQPPLSPRESARLRLIVLRDTMRMEMPDRLTDILYPPTLYCTVGNTSNNSPAPGNRADDIPFTVTSRAVPGKLNNYRRKFNLQPFASPFVSTTVLPNTQILRPENPPTDSPRVPPLPLSFVRERNQSAELLYQIVAAANYQSGSALELFRPTEIGDTDGDFMPEFIDAWGTPISWIRWPAGFGRTLDGRAPDSGSQLNDITVADPMDPLRADWRHSTLAGRQPPAFDPKPWLLIPLIVSAGPDEVFDLESSDAAGF